MDRLAIIEGQKIVETTVTSSRKKTSASMQRLNIINRQKVVQTTSRFSSKKTIKFYG